MARRDNTIARKRLRDHAAAVIVAVIVLTAAAPRGASAGYRIALKDRTVETSCYWVERSLVHLCEGGAPLALSEVSGITPGSFSPLETELHRDALQRFRVHIAWLLDREEDLRDRNGASVDGLAELDRARSSPGNKKGFRDLKKRYAEELDGLLADVSSLDRAWRLMRIPERSLLPIQETKSLQMITWKLSLEERKRYIDTGDPTYREYTLEHMRQAGIFEDSFTRALRKGQGE